jgi:hypothetical protein
VHRPPADDLLTRERWQQACRALLAKLLGEFSYEELLRPRFCGAADGSGGAPGGTGGAAGTYRLPLGAVGPDSGSAATPRATWSAS